MVPNQYVPLGRYSSTKKASRWKIINNVGQGGDDHYAGVRNASSFFGCSSLGFGKKIKGDRDVSGRSLRTVLMQD